MANASGGGWGRLRLFLELHLCLGLSLGDLVDRLDAANQLAFLSEDRHREHLPRLATLTSRPCRGYLSATDRLRGAGIASACFVTKPLLASHEPSKRGSSAAYATTAT